MTSNQFTLSILPDGSLAGPVPGVSGGATWGAILAPGGPTGVLRHFLGRGGSPGAICRADDVLRPYAPVQFGRKGAGSAYGVVVRRCADALDMSGCESAAEAIARARELGWTFDVEPTPWHGPKGRGRGRGRVAVPVTPEPTITVPEEVRALILEAREAVRALKLSGAEADAQSLDAAVRSAAVKFKVS